MIKTTQNSITPPPYTKDFQIPLTTSYSYKAFPTIPRPHPNSLITFSFDLNEVSMKEMFNI
jgi:hypothetical protein